MKTKIGVSIYLSSATHRLPYFLHFTAKDQNLLVEFFWDNLALMSRMG